MKSEDDATISDTEEGGNVNTTPDDICISEISFRELFFKTF